MHPTCGSCPAFLTDHESIKMGRCAGCRAAPAQQRVGPPPDDGLPEKLVRWAQQPGATLSPLDMHAVQTLKSLSQSGVGFGFMQQILEWLWQEYLKKAGVSESGAWGPEYFARQIADLEVKVAKLQAFKDYVHKRLDEAGVPAEIPDSVHTKEGCRIGGRLDLVLSGYLDGVADEENPDAEDPHLSQPALIAGILCWLEKSGGVKSMRSEQINVVIKAADDILAAISEPERPAVAGMGLSAWLNSHDTGQSSLYMARALASGPAGPAALYDIRSKEPWPHDPQDFGRCVRLLDAVPELRPRIGVLKDAKHGPVWNAIAVEWDTLEAWYREDLLSQKSDRLYERLQAIKNAADSTATPPAPTIPS